ncbi:exodeoxyribonuclease VII small subunit [Nocardiopsis mangrovi]|uniref:Exodeoxyribonuclease 7 small subunit n=1 Tax=Nocardiopsis mangrovi TaxID=1179818 RepID=A0ABV9DRW2_9ACTN
MAGKKSARASGAEANGGGEDDGAAAEPELGYEEAREELDSVVRRLESGGLTLKESLALWERGEELARVCEQWLEGARAKLAVAMEEKTGGPADPDTPF